MKLQIIKCPDCGGYLISTSHGPYCPKPTCKWGWEMELDGSPLKPPIHCDKQTEIDVSNLLFYTRMAKDFNWHTDVIHSLVISQTLFDICSRYIQLIEQSTTNKKI